MVLLERVRAKCASVSGGGYIIHVHVSVCGVVLEREVEITV